STAASAFVTELVDFAAHCRLDYAASLVAESVYVCPPSVGDPDAPDIPTPRSYAEAIEGPYSSQWQAAMDAEMASWKSTGTYVDVVPPPGANIVSGMWIFRVKQPPGSPPVFKARYVARGFSQRQGVDYFQTFSPTPKMSTLRVLLHVPAQRDYELHSLDFNTAFLQGSLHEEIWLRRPPGFTGSFPPGTQWSLRRPVYGLRQAPREWHDTLRTTLAALGLAPSTADPSLFLRTDTLLPPFYILVYVDDLVFATADTAGLAHVKSELQKRHTCINVGELRSYLGLQITRDRAWRTISLTQSHMVQQVLQRFDFTYSSPATPLSTRHSLSALPSDESVEPTGPYPELVGCLMYLMTYTRQDLAYPLSILARYVAPRRHRPEHMATAKRVLRYLCSTSELGLVLGGRSPVVLTGHADASWVDDMATQRSSQGFTFSLGSGSVSWRSTRSSSVLSSRCEAEIYAGAMAAQELRLLTYLLTDLGEPPRSPPVLTTCARGLGAAEASGAAGAGGAGAAGAGGARAAGTALRIPFFYPQLQPTLPPPDSVFRQSLTERCEPETRASTPVRARRVARPRPATVPGTHGMAIRPFSVPQSFVLPEPPASSLPHVRDPESDLARAASPIVTRLLATNVSDPDLESTAAFALVTELVDFAVTSRLESESICPPSVGGELALGSDVLEDKLFELECLAVALPRFASMLLCPEGDPDALDIPTPRSYAEAIAGFSQRQGVDFFQTFSPTPKMTTLRVLLHVAGEYSSQWQTATDAEMASWKSTGTYVDKVPPSWANIVDGMWIFRMKRPPGSPPAFKACYVARGFSQQQGVEFFLNFSPTPKMNTLRMLLHVAAQCDYELHTLDFSTAFLQGSLHKEIWLHRPPGFTGSFRAVKAELQERHTCTDMGLVLGGQGSVVLTGHSDASWVDDQATQRLSQGYTFSLGSGSVSWRSTHSSSVLSSSCEAEIYAGAMAAQELRWVTYLLTDLGEQPRSPPVLYVDNKAMLVLCHEQIMEHITKHIALRYFLARELQQRRQLRLSYVASRANTADVFTKALGTCDHQRFCTSLGLVPTLPHLLVA
ncbi:unnamed protein product, partial [Closterium sp. NIES-54]